MKLSFLVVFLDQEQYLRLTVLLQKKRSYYLAIQAPTLRVLDSEVTREPCSIGTNGHTQTLKGGINVSRQESKTRSPIHTFLGAR